MDTPTINGRYIDLYREHCGTTPILNNQECEVLRRLVEECTEPLKRELAEAQKDAEAVRALMNCYNVGGWTDAVAPMKRALAAEAKLSALEALMADGWRLVPEELLEEILSIGLRRHRHVADLRCDRIEASLNTILAAAPTLAEAIEKARKA